MKSSITSSKNKILMIAMVSVIWILIWQFIYIKVGQELLVASPLDVFKRIGSLSIKKGFWQTIWTTFSRIFIGFALGVVTGTILAIVTSSCRFLYIFFKPILVIIRTTPVASFIVLALVWLKSYRVSVFIAFLMVLPLVWANVSAGIAQTDSKLLEMAKLFGFNTRKKLKHIYIPSVIPSFVAACTTGIGFAWKAGIAAEIIGRTSFTIGKEIYDAKMYLETVDVFAWTTVVIVLSLIFEKLFVWIIATTAKRGDKQ